MALNNFYFYKTKFLLYIKEIITLNCQNSICIIRSKRYSHSEKEMFFKFDILGASLGLNLRASEIVKNKKLLDRFSFYDKNEIIFYSGICIYKISDCTLTDAGEWIITIQVNFKNELYFKKFTPEDLLNDKVLYKKLGNKDQLYITSLINDNKIIPFVHISSHLPMNRIM